MFEHTFEKIIASSIVEHYNSHMKICEESANLRVYKIGILFQNLIKQIDIPINIINHSDNVDIMSKSGLLDVTFPEGEEIMDLGPIFNKDKLDMELTIVKFIQTIAILRKLEKENLIIIYRDTNLHDIITKRNDAYSCYKFTDPDLVSFVKKLIPSRILPTTALIELSKYDYKSEDKRQYEKQVELSEQAIKHAENANIIASKALFEAKFANIQTRKSIRIAKFSNWIAILIAIITLGTSIGLSCCIPVSLKDETIIKMGKEMSKIPLNQSVIYNLAPNIKTDSISNENTKHENQ